MDFKVGQQVLVKSEAWFDEQKIDLPKDLKDLCGKIITIRKIYKDPENGSLKICIEGFLKDYQYFFYNEVESIEETIEHPLLHTEVQIKNTDIEGYVCRIIKIDDKVFVNLKGFHESRIYTNFPIGDCIVTNRSKS